MLRILQETIEEAKKREEGHTPPPLDFTPPPLPSEEPDPSPIWNRFKWFLFFFLIFQFIGVLFRYGIH